MRRDRPACVYRAYDLGGTLLYVGSSVTPHSRYDHHSRHSPWWPFHVDMNEKWFGTEAEAREVEARAIREEHPRWNVMGRSPEHPDGLFRTWEEAPHLAAEMALWKRWRNLQRTRVRLERRIEDVEIDMTDIASARMDARLARKRAERAA